VPNEGIETEGERTGDRRRNCEYLNGSESRVEVWDGGRMVIVWEPRVCLSQILIPDSQIQCGNEKQGMYAESTWCSSSER
jgi:hypothetical protein